jgi:hypothetical protein
MAFEQHALNFSTFRFGASSPEAAITPERYEQIERRAVLRINDERPCGSRLAKTLAHIARHPAAFQT